MSTDKSTGKSFLSGATNGQHGQHGQLISPPLFVITQVMDLMEFEDITYFLTKMAKIVCILYLLLFIRHEHSGYNQVTQFLLILRKLGGCTFYNYHVISLTRNQIPLPSSFIFIHHVHINGSLSTT